MTPAADVIVVGAGLAGLSCAFELAQRGHAVVVLESQPQVGGRTSSWIDPDGMRVESGLHRMLGVYTAFPDLMRRAGVDPDQAIVWEDEIEFLQPAPGTSATFSVAPMRNPLQVLGDVLGHNDYLPPAAKLSWSAFIAAGLAEYTSNPAGLDEKSALQYATERSLNPQAISRLLEPLVAGIYFVPAAQLSAYVFFALIGPYVKNAAAMRVGSFSSGMTDAFARPIADAIARKGGRVLTARPVDDLFLEAGRVLGVRAAGELFLARHVVLASSLRTTQELVRPHFSRESWTEGLLKLPTMPAVTLQLELDAPAMRVDRTTFGVGTSLACFSEQSRTTFRGTTGRLSIIMAPSDKLIDQPIERVLRIALEDADRLGLPVRDRVKRYRMVNHRDDFYSLAPGHDHLRPPQATPVRGLSLAGDYTRQRFVATMEGAVVSGQLAAEAALADLTKE